MLSGQEQQQKLRINASGRVATLLEKKQRGWLVVELDENQGEDGAPFEQRSIRSNFVTFLDSAGNDVIPTKKKRKRPSVPAIAPPAPGQQPVSFAQVSDQNRPRSGSVDLDAPPPPKPKKRTKRNKVEYNTGDRIRVVEHAKYQGRLGTVVKRTVAWVEVHLDSLQPGEKELTASFRRRTWCY